VIGADTNHGLKTYYGAVVGKTPTMALKNFIFVGEKTPTKA
jgi:hypothetical protein